MGHGYEGNGNHPSCQLRAFFLLCTLDVHDPHCCSCLFQSHIHSGLSLSIHSHHHGCAGLMRESTNLSACVFWGEDPATGGDRDQKNMLEERPDYICGYCSPLSFPRGWTGTWTRWDVTPTTGIGRCCSGSSAATGGPCCTTGRWSPTSCCCRPRETGSCCSCPGRGRAASRCRRSRGRGERPARARWCSRPGREACPRAGRSACSTRSPCSCSSLTALGHHPAKR